MRIHRVLLPAIVLLVAGCFQYIPTDFDAAEPGTTVEVTLTGQGAEKIQQEMGGRLRNEIRGDVVQVRPDRVLLDVPLGGGNPGQQGSVNRRIELVPGDVNELVTQELNRRRTALVVGGGAAAVGLSFFLARETDPGGQLPPPTDGGEFSRLFLQLLPH